MSTVADEKEKAAIEKAAKKEENRLKKEPFKTLFPPDFDETSEHLKGWVEPTYAYVLFEARGRRVVGEGDFEVCTRLFTMNVEARPEQSEKVQYYLNKGFKIIHYGNFPTFSDPNPQRAQMAILHSKGSGSNMWHELKKFLDLHMKQGNAQAENIKLKAEKDALEQKIAEFQAKGEKPAKPSKPDAEVKA
jgi:hypothetical protein